MWTDYIPTWPFLVIIAALSVLFVIMTAGPKTATVDSRRWVCTASDTIGLEARCIRYERVSSFQERK